MYEAWLNKQYMRKPKTAEEVTVMEVAQSSFAGVRTLALQRLQKSQPQPSSQQQSPASSGSYLQLRNRRLEKPPILIHTHCSKRQRQAPKVARLQNPGLVTPQFLHFLIKIVCRFTWSLTMTIAASDIGNVYDQPMFQNRDGSRRSVIVSYVVLRNDENKKRVLLKFPGSKVVNGG